MSAFQVGDAFIVTAALITIGAILGFFVWNFPAGLIFLGDGGAYLLGFLFGELGVLLVARNASVSPWFPVHAVRLSDRRDGVLDLPQEMPARHVARHPGRRAPAHADLQAADALDARLVEPQQKTARNSMTSPYLWLLCMLSVIPALLYWDSTPFLLGFSALFVVSYVLLYWSIVRFHTPKWLVVRR